MAKYVPKDPLIFRFHEATGSTNAVGCLLALFMVPLGVLLLPFSIFWRRRKVARFIRRLRERGRVLTWAEFLADLHDRPGGTVILEVGNKCPTRFWRTADAVRSLSPVEPPTLAELDLFSSGSPDYHPFARWCYERYLAPDCGIASLVHPAEPDFSVWRYRDEEQIRSHFPGSVL